MRSSKSPRKEVQAPKLFVSILLLLGLTCLVYANSLNGRFVFDDQQIVLQNPQLINIQEFDDVLKLSVEWRRLTYLTYGLNYYFGQLNPFGYHLLNVVLHALNSVLVFLIILHISDGRKNSAMAGAAVFSVHPLFTEAVSYIAGRASSLCALFYFLAILCFLKALDMKRLGVRLFWFGSMAVAGFLAWESKQEAITLPVAIAGVLWVRGEKKDWRFLIPLAVVPILVVSYFRNELATLFESVMGNVVLVSAGFEPVLPWPAYFRTYVSAIIGYYFPHFIVPVPLSADPYVRTAEHWYSLEFLFASSLLATLAWLLLRPPKTIDRFLLLGLALLLLSPLTAYAVVPLADVVLEHRAYIPGLGAAIVWAWMFDWLSKKYGRTSHLALLAVVMAFSVMTIQRNTVWRNSIALWEDTEAKSERKPRPHFNLGQSYQEARRFTEAIREYEHALKLKPDIYAAYSNIAAIYLDQGLLDPGEEMLVKVTTLAPSFTEGFINLGVLYIRKKDPDKALAAISRALEINPQSFSAHYNKGEALSLKGDLRAALESYKQAVYLRPDLHQFRLTLGAAYLRAGDRQAAEKEFKQVAESSTFGAEACRNLGILYTEEGDYDKALEYLHRAARMRPHYPDLHHEIGTVYLRKQMMDPAIEAFQTTITQQPGYGPAYLNLALAYQAKGQIQAARGILENYIQQFQASGSPYIAQARERLSVLK